MLRLTSFGDLAHLFQRSRQMSGLKERIARTGTELTTGLVQDSSRHLTMRTQGLAALETTLKQLDAFSRAAKDTGLRLGAATAALDVIEGQASDLSVELLKVTPTSSTASLSALSRDASERFSSAVEILNTRLAGQSLFAGAAVDQTALRPADEILGALETVLAGAFSAADVDAAVSNWFDDPAGFAAFAYLGGAPVQPIAVSSADRTAPSVTALDEGLRDTLKGLATAALLDRGILPGNAEAKAQLAFRAGERLFGSLPGLTALGADLGYQAARADAALSRNQAETSALQMARADMIGADPFVAATELEEAQTQLESVFAITARMSRLNLMDFLR